MEQFKEKRARKKWTTFFRYCATHPIITTCVCVLTSVSLWGGFNWSMALTNTESFCISCHEMRRNVYQEYKKTIHYVNRTGVRATCPDCHVPKEWGHMVVRKIAATNELYHKIIGSVDTPEKFDAKRLVLAEHVWNGMRETDSRECRNCHAFNFMALSGQREASRRAHMRAIEEKRTCIDCHMGVAHKMAKNYDQDGKLHAAYKKENRLCTDCHKGMQQSEGW